jgi:hypothetical protein
VAEAVLGHSIMALNLWRVVLRQGMRLIENHLTLKLSHNWPVIKELLAGNLKESRQLIDRLLCRADSNRYPRNLLLLRLVKKMFVAGVPFSKDALSIPLSDVDIDNHTLGVQSNFLITQCDCENPYRFVSVSLFLPNSSRAIFGCKGKCQW